MSMLRSSLRREPGSLRTESTDSVKRPLVRYFIADLFFDFGLGSPTPSLGSEKPDFRKSSYSLKGELKSLGHLTP